jgi:chromosome partitioning protein
LIFTLDQLGNFMAGSQRILSISSQKGGTGKTTTAINLGAWLALMERKVLLVDLDPQADLTRGLGLSSDEEYGDLAKWLKLREAPRPVSEKLKVTMYEVLLNPAGGIQQAILPTVIPGLSCAPSALAFAGAETELANAPDRAWRLSQALDSCPEQYDFIIIDTPPSLGLFTQNAFLACTEILVPLQMHYFSLRAMQQLLVALELMSQYNDRLHIGGIVCTMYDRRNALSRVIEEAVRERFGKLVFDTVIPVNVALAEAPASGRPVSLYSPLSMGAQAYYKLAQETIRRERSASPAQGDDPGPGSGSLTAGSQATPGTKQ